MPRTVKLTRQRNQGEGGELPYNEWIPAHAVKFQEDGKVQIMTEAHPHHPHATNPRRMRKRTAARKRRRR